MEEGGESRGPKMGKAVGRGVEVCYRWWRDRVEEEGGLSAMSEAEAGQVLCSNTKFAMKVNDKTCRYQTIEMAFCVVPYAVITRAGATCKELPRLSSHEWQREN